jgi:hypothetical protein
MRASSGHLSLGDPWAVLPSNDYFAWVEAFAGWVVENAPAPVFADAGERPAPPPRDEVRAVAREEEAAYDPPTRAPSAAAAPPERLVQLIWAEQHLTPGPYATERGRSLEVVHPGRWNAGAGPDFLAAELRLDGHAVRGDVEVHVNAGDWRSHRHGEDFDYNGVVLHVVLDASDGAKIDRLQNGDKIERLVLRPLVFPDLDTLAATLRPDELAPGGEVESDLAACHGLVARIEAPALERLLDLAADERLADKVRRVAALSPGGDLEQMIYQSLLTYLGQGASKPLFFLLARRLPLSDLRLVLGDLAAEERRAEAATALLMAVASLLPTEQEIVAAAERRAAKSGESAAAGGVDDALAWLQRARGWWAQARPYLADRVLPPTNRWNAGVRPVNFAPRLLDGFARLVTRMESARGGDLVEAVASLFPPGATGASWKASERRALIKATELAFEVDEPKAFWARRYSLTSAPAPGAMKLIGPQRAALLSFNAVLPCAMLIAERRGDERLTALLGRLYRAWPPLQDNAVSRFMTWRLFAGDPRAKSLLRGEARRQALHQIYRDCCDHDAPGGAACPWFGGPLGRGGDGGGEAARSAPAAGGEPEEGGRPH